MDWLVIDGWITSTIIHNQKITAQQLQKMDVVAHGSKLYKKILMRFPDHDVDGFFGYGLVGYEWMDYLNNNP